MKKKFYLYTTVSIILFSACSKDFLVKGPTENISKEDLDKAVEQDPALLYGSVAGLYALMFQKETGGTTGDDDFGQKAQDINMDLLTTDMVIEGTNYGWYSAISRYQPTVDFTNNVNYIPWRYYYRVILSANTIIDALGGTDVEIGAEDEDARYIMGQAKAMRAYCYFYLAQLFGQEGYGTGEEYILPIYKSIKDADMPLSKSKDVYDLIISDLTQAVEYLNGFVRTSKSQINKYVAEGLLVYALMSRGTQDDWQEVVGLTDDIIANSGHPLTSRAATVAVMAGDIVTNPESGFNNVATPSWMWGTDLTAESNIAIASWWGHMDGFTYSYASAGDAKLISEDLYGLIPADDIRKNQFDEDLFPIYKLFDPNRVWDGQVNITTDLLYMRVDEFYLLNAEANANLTFDVAARTSLKRLLDLRIDDPSYVDALSGQALKDEIYLQTRIELWGEGKIYLAMKRNKKTITVANNHLFNAGENIPYNASKMTLKIPQSEILNNPNID